MEENTKIKNQNMKYTKEKLATYYRKIFPDDGEMKSYQYYDVSGVKTVRLVGKLVYAQIDIHPHKTSCVCGFLGADDYSAYFNPIGLSEVLKDMELI